MNLFEGLFFYEIVLLILGVLLFLVLLFVLVYSVLRRQEIKNVVLLFPLSIIIIGFPGIQKIKYDNGVIEIEKLAKKVDQNPTDQAAREALVKTLSKIETRPIASASTHLTIAKAQVAIGEKGKARMNVESVLRRDPDRKSVV